MGQPRTGHHGLVLVLEHVTVEHVPAKVIGGRNLTTTVSSESRRHVSLNRSYVGQLHPLRLTHTSSTSWMWMTCLQRPEVRNVHSTVLFGRIWASTWFGSKSRQ